MKRIVLIFTAVSSVNAFAASKKCAGTDASAPSVLGQIIDIDIHPTKLNLVAVPKSFEDAIGLYDAYGKDAQGRLKFEGDDSAHQDGYTFLYDEATGALKVTLISGIQGKLDANYSCFAR
jgi:hypothetical protein